MTTTYEWGIEYLDEDGDIVDTDHRDVLNGPNGFQPGDEENDGRLVLIRNTGSEDAGLTDRMWAYVKDGKLPEFFENANGLATGYKVPQRFHREVAKRYKTAEIRR